MYIENNNRLKELVEYIEKNLTEEIEYKDLAKILAVNEYTLHRIFSFVTNITLAEYIRKRRLSMAAIDLLENNEKVLDVAIKYQYDSGEAFARAFKKMMGFLPKDIHKNKDNIKYLQNYIILQKKHQIFGKVSIQREIFLREMHMDL